MERVICIYLPQWEIDLIRRRISRRRQGKRRTASACRLPPMIISVEVNQRQHVARCCPLAMAAGVSPAMDISEAVALCPQAEVHPWQPDIYRQNMEKLAQWAGRFSPRVMIDPTPHEVDAGFCTSPHGLLIDASGTEHLHGGCRVLLCRIRQALNELGFSARLSAAPTIGSAWALAHYGAEPAALIDSAQLPQALAPLPIAALRLAHDICLNLYAVGIIQIKHLFNIQRNSLLERFGPHLLRCMDQSLGQVHEDMEPFTVRPVLSVTQPFDGPTTRLEVILAAMEQLVHQLAEQLMQRHQGADELDMVLTRPHHESNIKKMSFGRPIQNPHRMWTVLRPCLERMHLGSGVEAVALIAVRTSPVTPQQTHISRIHASSAEPDDMRELLDRLINQWGGRRLWLSAPEASHIPECTCRKEPILTSAQCDSTSLRVPWPPLDRPSIVFDKPEPAQCVALQPDHPPHRLRWRHGNYAVISHTGPERIVTHRTLISQHTRDYFKLQLEDGRWLWVYHALEEDRWLVNGLWG